MKRNFVLTILCFSLVAITFMANCGDDGSDSSTSANSSLVDVTGTWDLVVAGYNIIVMELNQNNEDITGTVTPLIEANSETGTVAGSNIQNTLTLTIVFPNGLSSSLPGAMSGDELIFYLWGIVSDENNMGGSFTSSTTEAQGPWSAKRRLHSGSDHVR